MHDAIVVGGGHNGLVAAWYLAEAGLNVVVLERRSIVGGACTTEEIVPGYRCSTTSYLCSLLLPEVLEEMQLRRHGLELIPATSMFSPFEDGRSLFLRGDSRDRGELAKLSRVDAEAYPRFEATLARLAAVVRPWLRRSPPDLNRPRLRDMRNLGTTAAAVRRLSRADQRLFAKVLTDSAVDFLGEWFESPELIGALAAGGTIGIAGSPRSPGTAFVLLHYALGDLAEAPGGWAFARGGMGAITAAMASASRAAGVEIRTDAAVEQIMIDTEGARGVRLVSGETLNAGVVLSNADPQRTFLDLVDANRVPAAFRDAVARIRMTGNSAKLNLALAEVPKFTTAADNDAVIQGSIQLVGNGIGSLDAAYADYAAGQPSAQPYLDVTVPSALDPTLAPAGHHVMTVSIKYVPRIWDGRDWDDDQRAQLTRRVLSVLDRHAPGLEGAVLASQLLTPRDYESEFGLTGGSIAHGDMEASQLFFSRPVWGFARYATPVPNLYLCGSGTHPGGGVSGAPGRLAALEVLRSRRHGSVRNVLTGSLGRRPSGSIR